MPIYVIETTYHLPVYRQRRYEASNLEQACRLAVSAEGWDDEETNVDTSETFVTGIWQDAKRAYEGTALMIPGAFRETIQRKADLFDRLVVLLSEPARPMGLSETEFRYWLPKVLEALAQADEIDSGSLASMKMEPAP